MRHVDLPTRQLSKLDGTQCSWCLRPLADGWPRKRSRRQELAWLVAVLVCGIAAGWWLSP